VFRFRWSVWSGIGLALCAVTALSAGLAARQAAGQSTYNAGWSMSVRAERGSTHPGQAMLLAVAVTNDSGWATAVNLGCDPAEDIQVRDSAGALVWRSHATCAATQSKLNLAAGGRKEWTASWPAADAAGQPLPKGVYTVWGTLATLPVGSVVGPLVIEVSGDAVGPTATSAEHPEPTRTPVEHPEPTRTPGDRPEPTRTPVEEHPEPTATRVPESSPAFGITDSEGRQRMPDVAGNPEAGECQNLTVWWDESGHKIGGRFVGRDSRQEAFLISGDTTVAGAPSVAYNATLARWLVVWPGHSAERGMEIYARRVRCAAAEEAVFVVGSAEGDDDQPAAVAFGEAFGVVWRHATEGGGSRVVGARVVGTGTSNNVVISPEGQEASEPAVACEPGEPCLVAWTRSDGSNRDVIGRYWFPREEYVGDTLLDLATTGVRERAPALAWNGEVDAYLVVWTREGDGLSIQGRAVYPTSPRHLDDYALGAAATIRSDEVDADEADVAPLGRDFAVVWSQGAGTLEDIAGRRVSVLRDGHVLLLHPLVMVSDAEAAERAPAVSSARDPVALVVWEVDWPNNDTDISGRHVVFPVSGSGGLIVLGGRVTAIDDLSGSGRWTMRVDKASGAPFTCDTADVYYDGGGPMQPPAAVGDTVTVSGQALAGPHTCSIKAETTDVGGGRVLIGRMFLPAGHR
jgi:hypothetical protein